MSEREWLDALDRAARYYRQALTEILGECSHDQPRLSVIQADAEQGIRSADYELEQASKTAPAGTVLPKLSAAS